MGWNRRLPPLAEPPVPLSLPRWLGAGLLVLLVGVALFVLAASERVPQLKAVNIWWLCLSPLLLWVLVFAARAYVYGRALSHQQFLEEQADEAQRAWSAWAQRHLVVKACCCIFPEQVSAAALMQVRAGVLPSPPVAKRIAKLPTDALQREQAGIQLLLAGLAPALAELPAASALRVTLLCDSSPDDHESLKQVWLSNWQRDAGKPSLGHLCVVSEFSYGEVESRLKAQDAAMELLVVLQVCGDDAYSDGLAALLFSPDVLQAAPSTRLLRPMPVNPECLEDELATFLQTQAAARQAVGVLADRDACRPTVRTLMALASTQGTQLKAENQWTQSALCGLPGPFSHWLTTTLGVEMARHQQRPLLVLASEGTQGWIATVATEVSV